MTKPIERQLLAFIDDWNSSPDYPEGGAIVSVPEILTELRWPEEFNKDDPNRFGRKVNIEMQHLSEKGLIEVQERLPNGVWTGVSLTKSGHQQLETLQEKLTAAAETPDSGKFTISGTLSEFFKGFLLPLAVVVAAALIISTIGIKN